MNLNDEVMGEKRGGGRRAAARVWFRVQSGTVLRWRISVSQAGVEWRCVVCACVKVLMRYANEKAGPKLFESFV